MNKGGLNKHGQKHGYYERYWINNQISFRAQFHNGSIVGYVEWHGYHDHEVDFNIR